MVYWGSPCFIVANVLDCDIKVNEFELQSHYYVPFWTNTPGKGMNLLIPPTYELDSTKIVLLQGWLWNLIAYRD